MESIEVNPSPTPSAITTKLVPQTMDTIVVYVSEDVWDLNTIEDDDTPKDELEAIAMHSRKVEKQRHLLLEILLIFSLEDCYMIGLLGQQNYNNIVKNAYIMD
jgi:hypothetical protein